MNKLLRFIFISLFLSSCASTNQTTKQQIDYNRHTTCIQAGYNDNNEYREVRLINFNEKEEISLEKIYIMISDGKSKDTIPIYLANEEFILTFLAYCKKSRTKT